MPVARPQHLGQPKATSILVTTGILVTTSILVPVRSQLTHAGQYWPRRRSRPKYVGMFVSVRGVPTWHRAFRAWLTGRWWSLKPGQPLWAAAGHPEDALGAGKNGWKITLKGSVSSGFAPRDHRCPPEGKRWPRGHGRHYKIQRISSSIPSNTWPE